MKRTLAVLLLILCVASPLFAYADTSHIVDNASLFSESDIQEIQAAIQRFQQTTNLDFSVLTTNDYLGADTQKATGYNFYMSQGYGLDSNQSGVNFYISMNPGIMFINTIGLAIDILDPVIESALDLIEGLMRAGLYRDAVITLIAFVTAVYDTYTVNTAT